MGLGTHAPSLPVLIFLNAYLHVSLQLLQQGGVLVQPHEGLAEAGGEGQDAWAAGPLALHELVQLLTGNIEFRSRI